MKVRVDRSVCIGCGTCEVTAPEIFQLDDEGLARVLVPESDDEALLREAAEGCCVDAIILQNDDGTQVYP